MKSYEELLKQGLEKVPVKLKEKSRFEMPRASVARAGQWTFINNFFEVSEALRRDPKHLQKYLLKELATKGEVQNKRLSVLGNFPEELVNRKVEQYIKMYVLCPECGKPDSRLTKDGEFTFLVCEACGARHPVAD
ncbi:MAG: translation initiation factor IF-2 subunit beta [Candidatus Aenigmarchaeota archaeon]|nr:translation initiation factor IF-2 subunit beta [Candidatus Aenigmarchaeota archaeon]